MKLPVSWLKEWVPVSASGGDDIAKRLTFAGLEIESVQEVAGDTVLEVNVTPNRGDCLSVRGLAREISALYGVALKPMKAPALKGLASSAIKINILKPKACSRYALALIDGVRVGKSPDWLVKRLEQTGLRTVNNIVDVTNYVLMELGQPLHAFDRSRLSGNQITVRQAKSDEILKTLDGVDRKLLTDDLVIADAEGPVALAGVMGGAGSEVVDATTSIVLECAFFDPATVRRTSRRLGLISDSSYRFERRVDPESIHDALCRAVHLITELAGGRLVSVADVSKEKIALPKIKFNPAEVGGVLGASWSDKEIRSSLQSLGFAIKPTGKKDWIVTVPSYRGDIERSIDLIEEVARLKGLNHIEEKFPALRCPAPVGSELGMQRRVKTLLIDLGLQETIHYSFVSDDMARILGNQDVVSLANPLSRDDATLRPSLLPSLLSAASLHARHKMETLRVFELRNVFHGGDGEKPRETKMLSGLLMGSRLGSHWGDGVKTTDFYDLKGVVESILRCLSLSERTAFSRSAVSYLHPGQQAEISVDGRKRGILGEVHPDILARFDLKKNAYVFELDWSHLETASRSQPRFKDYPRTPVVERDLALVLDEGIAAGDVLAFIRSRDPVISEAKVFDLYRGNQIPAGKKSLAFSLRLSRPEQTLTDPEVNEIFNRVIEGLKGTFQAEIR